jgi:hypothetical protein
MTKADLSADRLRELLHYDPETGIFTWKVRAANRITVGQIAGTISEGYVLCRVDGTMYRAHRLAWLYMTGAWPQGEVDHINHCRSDNRIANLRDVSFALNQQNRKKSSRNAAGLTGVTPHGLRWRARVKLDGKLVSLGTHDTPEQAHSAYVEAKRRMHPGNTL